MEKIEGRFNVLMMAALLLLPVQDDQPQKADEGEIAVSNTQV